MRILFRAACLAAAIVTLGCASFALSQTRTDDAETQAQKFYRFQQLAWRYAHHGSDETIDAKRASGVSCIHRAHRVVSFSGGGYVDHLGAAFVGENCSESELFVVAITLEAENRSEGVTYPRVGIDGPFGRFFSLYGGAPYDQQIETGLRKLIEGDPFPAGLLPRWPEHAIVPALPPGIVYDRGAERSLYEAIRTRNASIWCFSRHDRMLTCYAHAPGRARSIEILELHGFGPYGLQTTNEFVDVLIGRRPALTQEQYDSIEREERRQIQGDINGKRD